MSGLLLVCLVPVLLIFAPLGFGNMVSVIAKARGHDTKRLLSVAGFLYMLLILALLVAWIAVQIGAEPEIANLFTALLVLVVGFGLIIAPLIALAVRRQHPDLFKKVDAPTTAPPSNAPMIPEPQDRETRSTS